MAGQVRFYRGAAGTSLPGTHQNGSIFIIERANSSDGVYSLGDMYVDIDAGKRLHIIPDSGFKFYTSSMTNQTSVLGEVYIVTDNNNQIGIKVGDGQAFIGDLPQYPAITTNKMNSWSNKVNAYLGTEYYAHNKGADPQKQIPPAENLISNMSDENERAETLVLSRELWF